MATSRSLGVLSIDLIAKVGGFTEGMSRAEREGRPQGAGYCAKAAPVCKRNRSSLG